MYPQPTAARETHSLYHMYACAPVGCGGPRKKYHRSQPSQSVGQTQVLDDRISRRRAPCTISYLAGPARQGAPEQLHPGSWLGRLLVPTHLDTLPPPAHTGIRLARRLRAGTEGHSPLALSLLSRPVVATKRPTTQHGRHDPVHSSDRTSKAVYLALALRPSVPPPLPRCIPLLHHHLLHLLRRRRLLGYPLPSSSSSSC